MDDQWGSILWVLGGMVVFALGMGWWCARMESEEQRWEEIKRNLRARAKAEHEEFKRKIETDRWFAKNAPEVYVSEDGWTVKRCKCNRRSTHTKPDPHGLWGDEDHGLWSADVTRD
jgi:hypothetical protein